MILTQASRTNRDEPTNVVLVGIASRLDFPSCICKIVSNRVREEGELVALCCEADIYVWIRNSLD